MEEEQTVLVHNLFTKSIQKSQVFFHDINDDFISKHVTLRLCHTLELIVEESGDSGRMVCDFINSFKCQFEKISCLGGGLVFTVCAI